MRAGSQQGERRDQTEGEGEDGNAHARLFAANGESEGSFHTTFAIDLYVACLDEHPAWVPSI